MELTVYISPHFYNAVLDRFGITPEEDKIRALVNTLNTAATKDGWAAAVRRPATSCI